jgi:hypothetical protein
MKSVASFAASAFLRVICLSCLGLAQTRMEVDTIISYLSSLPRLSCWQTSDSARVDSEFERGGNFGGGQDEGNCKARSATDQVARGAGLTSVREER